MPAYNEQEYLAGAVSAVVNGMRDLGEDFEVLICENGSSDSTAEVAGRLAGSTPEVRLVRLGEANYGRALQRGFLETRGDFVLNFDVDYIDVAFAERALAKARSEGVDVILGSKRVSGSTDTRDLGRRMVTAVFSYVLRYAFGLTATDTHGIKLLRRSSLAPLVESCTSGDDIFDTELIIRAERSGLYLTELPVTVVEQRPPRVSIRRRIPRSLLGLTRLRLSMWRDGG